MGFGLGPMTNFRRGVRQQLKVSTSMTTRNITYEIVLLPTPTNNMIRIIRRIIRVTQGSRGPNTRIRLIKR